MTTTKRSAYKLTYEDAVKVWNLHWEGHIQSRIAAVFGTNQGRVNEVLKERKFVGSRADAAKRKAA